MMLSMHLTQRLVLTQSISLPKINWSLVDAWRNDEKMPCRLGKKTISGFDALPLAERLAKADEANAVFRFAYTQAKDDEGKRGRYYKVPLMRDFNVDIEKIKICISKREYERAIAILEASGHLQRITRAVPLSQIHHEVLNHLARNGISLDDVAIVGIDRGGRVPTLVMKEVLGQSLAYFLKVDQGGQVIDEDRFEDLIRRGAFKGKYLVFVDSTVDSGRQIKALRPYFDNPEWSEKTGHTGWVVVGSNEHGETLGHHLNINWGLNPDESFEDDPLLLGVDYADGTCTRIKPAPSKTALDIRTALRESIKGIILDTETQIGIPAPVSLETTWKEISKAVKSRGWIIADYKCRSSPCLAEPMGDFPQRKPFEATRRSLAVFGSGGVSDLGDAELEYLALALSPKFVFHAGTTGGNPGSFLQAVNRHCPDSNITLYQPANYGWNDEFVGSQIIHVGGTKNEFREAMVRSADAVLILGGRVGTLSEALLSLHAGKPVIVVKNYGSVGTFLASSRKYLKFSNLHLVESLEEAAERLVGLEI